MKLTFLVDWEESTGGLCQHKNFHCQVQVQSSHHACVYLSLVYVHTELIDTLFTHAPIYYTLISTFTTPLLLSLACQDELI